MSLTLNKMFGQLDEALNINSDDSVFDYRYYIDLIEQTRAVDLRNEYNKTRSVHPSVKQKICVELELVDSYTCCDGLLTGCKLLRSKKRFPDTIEMHDKDGIISVKPADIFASPIVHVKYASVPSLGTTLISSKLIYSFLYDGYIWITSKNPNHKLMDKIVIDAIFVSPYSAAQNSCEEEDCLSYDSDYPLTEWMWQSLSKGKIIQELLGKQFIPLDNNNNAKDDKTELKNTK